MQKSRPNNYRGYGIAKSERTGFVVSKDGKPVIVVKSMSAAHNWIDREIKLTKEEET